MITRTVMWSTTLLLASVFFLGLVDSQSCQVNDELSCSVNPFNEPCSLTPGSSRSVRSTEPQEYFNNPRYTRAVLAKHEEYLHSGVPRSQRLPRSLDQRQPYQDSAHSRFAQAAKQNMYDNSAYNAAYNRAVKQEVKRNERGITQQQQAVHRPQNTAHDGTAAPKEPTVDQASRLDSNKAIPATPAFVNAQKKTVSYPNPVAYQQMAMDPRLYLQLQQNPQFLAMLRNQQLALLQAYSAYLNTNPMLNGPTVESSPKSPQLPLNQTLPQGPQPPTVTRPGSLPAATPAPTAAGTPPLATTEGTPTNVEKKRST